MAAILIKKPYTPFVFTSASKTFSVYGKSFFAVTNVYLSGDPFPTTSFFNPFSASPRLSAAYPGFYALKLPASAYNSNGDNTITFTMPSAADPGYVDIVVENEAGYGTLTQYVIRSTYNPYTSGTAEYNSFIPYQVPWRDGIIVANEETITSLVGLYPGNLLTTLSGEYLVNN
jgi:hypothetical protein